MEYPIHVYMELSAFSYFIISYQYNLIFMDREHKISSTVHVIWLSPPFYTGQLSLSSLISLPRSLWCYSTSDLSLQVLCEQSLWLEFMDLHAKAVQVPLEHSSEGWGFHGWATPALFPVLVLLCYSQVGPQHWGPSWSFLSLSSDMLGLRWRSFN